MALKGGRTGKDRRDRGVWDGDKEATEQGQLRSVGLEGRELNTPFPTSPFERGREEGSEDVVVDFGTTKVGNREWVLKGEVTVARGLRKGTFVLLERTSVRETRKLRGGKGSLPRDPTERADKRKGLVRKVNKR